MTPKGGLSQACGACKFQRRKCTLDCLLAPYFPADKPEVFKNVHRLFGVKKIVKTLEIIKDPFQRAEFMTSMIYQANMREMFPVLGCCHVIDLYYSQISLLEEELHSVYSQLDYYHSRHDNQVMTTLRAITVPSCLDPKDTIPNPSLWIRSPHTNSDIDHKKNDDSFPAVHPQFAGTTTAPQSLMAMHQQTIQDYKDMKSSSKSIGNEQLSVHSKGCLQIKFGINAERHDAVHGACSRERSKGCYRMLQSD
ncbi:LOB domain-containing protein 12-like [Punica granatum]|uniref:LOB domain-containing protein 12-like n=1 Tax=Punica granatum TaxID=22663 RepID=A0A218VZ94_PUNGR|nr:LOB domain-containing protein 12-like [Punica granatum]OWM65341.1 hypothetical protein CDL15_Pgr008931 [Punica granatum]